MATSVENNEAFQPGQLGTRHLLGVMALVCVVAALSASRLRSLPIERSAIAAAHWLLVSAVAVSVYFYGAMKRRRDRRAAGELLLRVLRGPLTDKRRAWLAWGLTAAVVLDGVLVSVVVLPDQPMFVFNFQAIFMQGLLWGCCLDSWAGNLYWLGFHEHGLLTKDRFYPWSTITRIVWSPQRSPRFVVYGDYHLEMTIDAADHDAVTRVLGYLSKQVERLAITAE